VKRWLHFVTKCQALVDLIGKFAQQKKATPAQIALSWLLAQKPWIVPIPGTTKLHRLEENIGAAEVELTTEDLRQLETAASKITLRGARYPEELQKLVGRSAEAGTSQTASGCLRSDRQCPAVSALH
jgi:hypothetical protein